MVDPGFHVAAEVGHEWIDNNQDRTNGVDCILDSVNVAGNLDGSELAFLIPDSLESNDPRNVSGSRVQARSNHLL